MGQALGQGGREWSGCGGVGIEDFLGLFVGDFELRALILEKIQSFPMAGSTGGRWRSI